FEPAYMTAVGMACDFVGHPIVSAPAVTDTDMAQFTHTYAINGKTLAVLPGSRRGEVTRMMEVFCEVLSDDRFAPYDLLFPTLPHLLPVLQPYFARLTQRVIPIAGDGMGADAAAHLRQTALSRADVALAASGTISLELARARTPMVIAYDMNWLSRQIISRMLKTDTVTLVNLVSETRAVPEYIGARCKPTTIADGLAQVIADPHTQSAAMDVTLKRLGQGGAPPGHRAAQAVLAGLDPNGPAKAGA
ncbi:MAG: lipid-A-disaccharide synthase, partial [Pseudomonadota bacterium]